MKTADWRKARSSRRLRSENEAHSRVQFFLFVLRFFRLLGSRHQSMSFAFRFGTHLGRRDQKAVRKIVSGLVKLLHPDGRVSLEELQEPVLRDGDASASEGS